MNRRITFAAAVAVVSGALFAQDSITFDLSQMKGASVAMLAEPITNKLVLYPCTNEVTRSVLSVDGVVKNLREQGDMTNLVKKLVESGDVCAVVGHKWESLPHCVVFGYRQSGEIPQHRKCILCGKTETKEPGAWK